MGNKNFSIFYFTLSLLLFTQGCNKHVVPEQYRYLNFKGRVNQHKKLIKAKPDAVFTMITDIDIFKTLYPTGFIEVSQASSDYLTIGTLRNTQTKYIVTLNWDSKVIELIENKKIVLQFLNGIFQNGYEIWELEACDDYTEVGHTVLYNIHGFFYSLVWSLKKGENRHDYLVEETLNSLKRKAETNSEIKHISVP